MRTLRHAAAAAIVAFLVFAAAPSARAAPAPPAPTRVAIEFDDGWAGAYDARTVLKTYGMTATYYIASGLVGATGYMTWPQVATLAKAGHEIAGHTIDHRDLTSLSVASMRHQVCDDRVALAEKGYLTTSFAYPYGAFNADAEQIAAECGYNSARLVSGLRQNSSCTGCPAVEAVPPPDPFATRTFGSITSDNSVDSVKAWLTEAAGNGGWVQLIFHNICTSGCGLYSWTPTQLSQLLSWIKSRGSTYKVQTVNAVVGGAAKPVVASMRPAPFHNSSLENDDDADGTPDCWEPAGWGSSTPSFQRTHDAFAGDWAERLDVSDWASGNRKLLTERAENCAIKVTAGHTYAIGAWYKSTAPVAVEVYTQNADGGWDFWMSSPAFGAKSSWDQASVVTPPVPAGTQKLAFGLTLGANGSVTSDAWGFGDTAAALRTSIANRSLESAAGSQPDCWETAGWGTNTPDFTRTSDAFAGLFAERLTLSDWVSGDRKLLTGRDAGCRIAATPGRAYQLSGWYKGSVAPTMWVYVHDTPTDTWEFWTSKSFPSSSSWAQGAFTTPEIPPGKDAIAYGIGLDGNGTLTTDAYNIADAA